MKKCFLFLAVSIFALLLTYPHPTYAAVTTQDLNQYIQKIGLSKEALTKYLSDNGVSLNEFNSLSDLQNYLGQPLNAQTLPKVLKDFNMSQAELNQILKENGMSLTDYHFVNTLESDLVLFTSRAALESFMNAIGLTDQEITNLSNHFATIDLTKVTPQLQAIGEQLNSLKFDSTRELSAQDQATLTTSIQELLQLAQLKPKIYLQKDNQKQLISLNDLMSLQDQNSGHFLVELYNLNGQKLADVTINPAALSSDFIAQASKLMSYIQMLLDQTLNGGQLPNTATHTWDFLALGILILIIGAGILKRSMRKCA